MPSFSDPQALRLLLVALRLSRRSIPLLAVAAWAAACGPGTGPSAAADGCDRVAAPGGSDRAAGTVDAPFRTPQRLADALRAGQTGCLRAGTYAQEVRGPFVLDITRGGEAGAPVTLRSYPGERAALRGVIEISPGADHVTIADLDLDGRRPRPASDPEDNPIGIQILARATRLEGNRITNPGRSCVTLGYDRVGTAVGAVVRGNLFHDCGTTANDMHDHAIYANDSDGGEIVENVFLRTATFAVHFYGRNRGLRVAHNVMKDNGGGVIFSGYDSRLSSGNVVERNVIADSRLRPGVQSWWGGRSGTGNVARSNCLSNNRGREIELGEGGFSAIANVTADPRFLDAAANDLRLSPSSPCLAVVGYDAAARVSALGAPQAGALLAPKPPVSRQARLRRCVRRQLARHGRRARATRICRRALG